MFGAQLPHHPGTAHKGLCMLSMNINKITKMDHAVFA